MHTPSHILTLIPLPSSLKLMHYPIPHPPTLNLPSRLSNASPPRLSQNAPSPAHKTLHWAFNWWLHARLVAVSAVSLSSSFERYAFENTYPSSCRFDELCTDLPPEALPHPSSSATKSSLRRYYEITPAAHDGNTADTQLQYQKALAALQSRTSLSSCEGIHNAHRSEQRPLTPGSKTLPPSSPRPSSPTRTPTAIQASRIEIAAFTWHRGGAAEC
ncbi:hypothetical protein G7Y79_00018g045590 [Physcia stellaris]|nr:hypothetical protein G7Y79_00018g045590 [Physcia stellaris]